MITYLILRVFFIALLISGSRESGFVNGPKQSTWHNDEHAFVSVALLIIFIDKTVGNLI